MEENELPNGWIFTRLDQICSVTMGQSPPSDRYNDNGIGLPFFQGKAEFTDLFPIVKKWCTESTRLAEANDILLSIRAPVGPTNLASSLCVIGRGLAAIRPKDKINVRYVLYTIRAFNSALTKLATGTTFAAVSGDDVRQFKIPLAPLPEQQRIVAAIEQQFTRLDAGVAALKSAKTRLKRYRAAVLKAAVEGKLTEAWRAEHPISEPASQLLTRILQERRPKWEADQRAKGKDPAKVKYVEPAATDVSGLPELPQGWCLATVDELADVIGGVTKGRDLKGRVVVELPYLRVANVQRDFLDLRVMKVIEIPQDEVGRYLLHDGDVLMTEGGDADKLGRAALWQNQITPCIHQNHIFRVRLSQDIQPSWLVFYANSEQGQAYFLKSAKQTVNLASINLTQLRHCPIPIPPLEEQQQIVSEVERRLSVVSQLETMVEANLKRAERLRQSVLKEAFAGRLVPQDPDDEPASVLLERIRQERESVVSEGKGRKKGKQQRVNSNTHTTREQDMFQEAYAGKRIVEQEPEPLDESELAQVALWNAD